MGGIDSQFQKAINYTIAANGVSRDISSPNSTTSVIQLSGTWVGTLVIEGSNNGSTYDTIQALSTSTNLFLSSLTINGHYISLTNGYQNLRIRSSAWTSGTVTIDIWGSDAPSINHVIGLLRGATDGTLIGNTGNKLLVDGSTVTQPISAASLPLPSGAATSALQTQPGVDIGDVTINNASGVSAVNIQDGGNSITVDGTVGVSGSVAVTGPLTDAQLRASAVPISAASLPLPTGAATSAIQTDGTQQTKIRGGTDGTIIGNSGTRILNSGAVSMGDSIPVPSGYQPIRDPYQNAELSVDYFGNLNVRGQVLTDEGSFRDDFIGTTLVTSLTGTLNWTLNSNSVIGVGTLFTQELTTDSYIKKTADADSLFVQVLQIISDTQLILADTYAGTTASGVASQVGSWIRQSTTGTIAVLNSICSITSGNSNGNTTYIQRAGDYGPMTMIGYFNINQRVANQNVIFGFRDSWVSPTLRAEFNFNGTTNTVVQTITSSSASANDTETNTITIPNSGVSSSNFKYTIDIADEKIVFSINDIVVSTHFLHIPSTYAVMDLFAGSVNTGGGAGGTILASNYIQFKNYDRVNVGSESPNAPLTAQIQGTSSTNRTSIASVDDDFSLAIKNIYQTKATYSASVNGLVVAASATDIFTLTGSATKTIRVTKILISGTQSTAASNNVIVLKRSTANSAGTSTAPTKVAHDSTSAAASGTVLAYTANPTTGTLVGNISIAKVFIPSGTSTNPSTIWLQEFGLKEQAIVLRGVNEVLAINLGGVTLTSGSMDVAITWIEE